MSVFVNYLNEKKKNGETVKVYLKSTTTGRNNKIISKMLTGLVHSVDEETLRLENEECIIERSDIVSVKPDNNDGGF
jgi:ssDNA-binding replication factor A large subunit